MSATLAYLLSDKPLGGRLEKVGAGPAATAAAMDRVPEGAPAAIDPASKTVGRLTVSRANRALVDRLLSDRPLASPTTYFDASGKIQRLPETGRQSH